MLIKWYENLNLVVDIRYAEIKDAFEKNAKELPRDVKKAEVFWL